MELLAALAGLPQGERDVVLLVALGQLSHEEVAQALGISAGTVGSRLSRARDSLIPLLSELPATPQVRAAAFRALAALPGVPAWARLAAGKACGSPCWEVNKPRSSSTHQPGRSARRTSS